MDHDPTDLMASARTLRLTRMAQEMSHAELAELSGVGELRIRLAEDGDSISATEWRQLEQALGVKLAGRRFCG